MSRPSRIPRHVADRLALIGTLASLAVALAGAASLAGRARTVDVVTVVAGVLGAVVSFATLVVRRRRAVAPRDAAPPPDRLPPRWVAGLHTPPTVPWRDERPVPPAPGERAD